MLHSLRWRSLGLHIMRVAPTMSAAAAAAAAGPVAVPPGTRVLEEQTLQWEVALAMAQLQVDLAVVLPVDAPHQTWWAWTGTSGNEAKPCLPCLRTIGMTEGTLVAGLGAVALVARTWSCTRQRARTR